MQKKKKKSKNQIKKEVKQNAKKINYTREHKHPLTAARKAMKKNKQTRKNRKWKHFSSARFLAFLWCGLRVEPSLLQNRASQTHFFVKYLIYELSPGAKCQWEQHDPQPRWVTSVLLEGIVFAGGPDFNVSTCPSRSCLSTSCALPPSVPSGRRPLQAVPEAFLQFYASTSCSCFAF